jgi:1-deoxy-D-xylulose-5-phosphate synthase
VNARFVKPLDTELILSIAKEARLIVTVEEAYLAGGFGSAVLELLEENALADKVKVVRMGVPDQIVTHGDPKLLLSQFGLNAEGIAARVRETLELMDERPIGKKRLKVVK